MKAEVKFVTPLIALNILRVNQNNRKVSEKKVNEYVESIKRGDWKENGESIIIDKKGNLKDGQHRLNAIIKSNTAFNLVVVTEVEENIMHTIDIGKNRSLKDVLMLNGAKSCINLSSLINKIYKYNNNSYSTGVMEGTKNLTNSIGLQMYLDYNKEYYNLTLIGLRIYDKQTVKAFSASELSFLHYMLVGYNEDINAVNFLMNISGCVIKKDNSASWIFKKIALAKESKTTLSRKWVLAMVIKAWNLYVEGDPAVSYMTYQLDQPLPQIIRINNQELKIN